MSDWWDTLGDAQTLAIIRATVLLVTGLVGAKLVSAGIARLVRGKLTQHQTTVLRLSVFYLVLALFIASALRELGFSLATLLGAAGILSVAIGFAAQTSASNFISGLFLMAEKPFAIGDMIKVDDTTGEVLSIDALSVKLRTYDNRYVRIPNEMLLKSQTTTLTRFPIRRIDLKIGVAYKEDLKQVRKVLERVADENPLCLEEPKTLFLVQGFGDSAVDIQFSVWTKRQNYVDMKNAMYQEVKAAFDAEGIEIPFPHRTLYAGSVTGPLPVELRQAPPAEPEE